MPQGSLRKGTILSIETVSLVKGLSAERSRRMNSIPVNHWEDLQKGAYKFPAENRSFLQNLFVTAANAENEKQIKIHIPESGVYRDVIARYRLRGIRLKTVKRDNWNYQYTAVVRPGVLLGSMRRFRKAGPA